MLQVLAYGTYRHLFAARVIALVGTGVMTVALGLLAYQLAGDRTGAVLGTALAIKMVAYVGIRAARWRFHGTPFATYLSRRSGRATLTLNSPAMA